VGNETANRKPVPQNDDEFHIYKQDQNSILFYFCDGDRLIIFDLIYPVATFSGG
jgi:hypothetical protein